MPELAMVAALEREIRPLVRDWRVGEGEHAGKRFRFFETDHCVAVCGGIGQEAARRATAALIARYHPTKVLSVGFAGALDANLKIGRVLEVHQLIDARDGSRKETGPGTAVLISFSSIAGEEQKRKLANAYHGYLPTPAQHKLGGYETWRARSSYLEVDAAPKIVTAVMDLLQQVSN